MLDKFRREINYLRISVTDKCNLRCTYCMPEEGVPRRKHEDFLTFEQIEKVVREAAELGIRKIRLTGGEPLVKNGIENLVEKISKIEGIEIVSMTTNGILLPQKADVLKKAGLTSVNISCDTLAPGRFEQLTHGGDLENALKGIDAAIAAGFMTKINMVVFADAKKKEIKRMQDFCEQKGIELQLINHYSLVSEKQEHYAFDRPPNCANCNRIRLLADGNLKPCLHSNEEIKVNMNDIKGSLIRTILSKPKSGDSCSNRNMSEIGG